MGIPIDGAKPRSLTLEIDMAVSKRLESLRKSAAMVGVRIEADRYDVAINGSCWGYWLIDAKTNEGVWQDENYSATLDELTEKVKAIRDERAPHISMSAFMANPIT